MYIAIYYNFWHGTIEATTYVLQLNINVLPIYPIKSVSLVGCTSTAMYVVHNEVIIIYGKVLLAIFICNYITVYVTMYIFY